MLEIECEGDIEKPPANDCSSQYLLPSHRILFFNRLDAYSAVCLTHDQPFESSSGDFASPLPLQE